MLFANDVSSFISINVNLFTLWHDFANPDHFLRISAVYTFFVMPDIQRPIEFHAAATDVSPFFSFWLIASSITASDGFYCINPGIITAIAIAIAAIIE